MDSYSIKPYRHWVVESTRRKILDSGVAVFGRRRATWDAAAFKNFLGWYPRTSNRLCQPVARGLLGNNLPACFIQNATMRSTTDLLLELDVTSHVWQAMHSLRLPVPEWPSVFQDCKSAVRWIPARGTHRRGRPKKTRRRSFQDDLARVRLMWNETEIWGIWPRSHSMCSAVCSLSAAREELSLSK